MHQEATQLVEQGLRHFEQGDMDAAFEAFAAALETEPSSARAFGGRGTVWHRRGNHEKALSDYNHAIALDPGYARGFFNRGVLRLEQDYIEESIADFDKAIGIAPEARFYCHRSRALSKIGCLRKAIDDLNECIRLEPENPTTYFCRGIAHADANEPRKAIQDFTEAICRDATVAAHEWRAHQFYRIGKYPEAVADLDQVIDMKGENADLCHRRGVALHQCKSYEAAVSDYDKAIHHDPNHPGVNYNRGLAWSQLYEYDNAIQDFDAAIQLDPDNYAAFAARGRAWNEVDVLDRALNDLTHSVSLNPDQPDVLNLRGQIWLELGETEKALADFDETIRQNPRHQRAFENRGTVRSELGESRRADDDFGKAEELKLVNSKTEIKLGDTMLQRKTRISILLSEHFAPVNSDNIAITERKFPFRIRADLQKAIESLFSDTAKIARFCGVRKNHTPDGLNISALLEPDHRNPAVAVPPQFEQLDIGENEPVRCLTNGLWLLTDGEQQFAVLLAPVIRFGHVTDLSFQIATENGPRGTQTAQAFFHHLEEAVSKSESYRGKTLSLEQQERYSGVSSGLSVHRLSPVTRDEVVLPQKTLELLDRNVIGFAEKRPRLSEMGLATKKGVLFYGPPGTGKTHAIHYLVGAMEGHTVFIVTAEQVGLLGEYMVLARLFQPSIVVIEDVDLIARDRNSMDSPCEEVLLNKLLNEMDGLRPNTEVLFVLTTNRPETLEQALASRPGRIDQAIEFPLPGDSERRQLIRLYSRRIEVSPEVGEYAVKETGGVSAAFIKELMRRAAQFHIEHSETAAICREDVDNALEELLLSGGSLNKILLGVRLRDEN